MASVGLPGLGDFIGEFLVLLGTYRASPLLASFAALGMIASALYGLRLLRTAFYGPNEHRLAIARSLWPRVVYDGVHAGLPDLDWLVSAAAAPHFRPVIERRAIGRGAVAAARIDK